jgi:hypothetical protein
MQGLERYAPLTGLLFVVLVLVAVIVGGETPGANDGIVKVIKYWRENDDQAIVASIIAAFSTVALLWFAGVWRAALAAAEKPPARLANTAFAGAVLAAAGWSMLIAFNFMAAETIGDVEPQVTQTFSALQSDFFFPLAIGFSVFLLASGLAMLRTGLFPAWMGWAAVVLGVLCVTPAGFFALLIALAGIIAVSLMLYMRGTPARPDPVSPPD